VSALYVDHGLRDPGETGDEKAFCADLCRRHGAAFDVALLQLAGRKGNLQQRARTKRYAVLRTHAKAIGADRIATGQTLDDQAETVLMRLIRGAARRGLSGIPAQREEIIRPLLFTSRRDIEDYLKASGIQALTDSSNLKEAYLRNRLRVRLLPLLESINPNIRETLLRTARTLDEEDTFLDALAAQALERMHPVRAASGMTWGKHPFDEQPLVLRRRILRLAVREVRGHTRGLSNEHIEKALRATQGAHPRSPQLPGGLVFTREHDRYGLRPRKEGSTVIRGVLPIPGTLHLPDGRRIEARRCRAGEPVPESATEVRVPSRLLGHELQVRSRQPGDTFHPLGMEGTKKLQDFFVDAKVPVSMRDTVPLVLSGDRIVWIAGYRLDHHFRCSPGTHEETVRLTLASSAF